MKPIYLDYNATTPVEQDVANEMIPYITEYFGNPSSSHSFGLTTRSAIEKAREQVAAMIQCEPYEVFFTGGGTESNNMAIQGAAYAHRDQGKHIIISAVEHPAVAEVALYLQQHGFEVSVADVDSTGRVNPLTIEKLIRPDTILISVMHANNEVGTIQPVKEIADIAHRHRVLMHSDAAQSVGKIPVNVADLGVDLLSIAGHKLYAPKGVGALYIRRGTRIEKFMHGANHEHDMRPGTENVPYIVALGKACELVMNNLEQYAAHMRETRDRLTKGLKNKFPDIRINGDHNNGIPNTLNVSFKNLGAGDIIRNLKDLAVSAGAACHAAGGNTGVLQAMNVPPEYTLGAMRISTGRYTTIDEVDAAVEQISHAVENIKNQEINGSILESNAMNITSYAYGMGCGCKMRPADLEYILQDLPQEFPPEVLVSAKHRDDAAVYRIAGEEAIVQTLDFFTPMVDNPYSFGAIAAANALSDVYAMGATPVFALNMVAFPVDKLPLEVLKDIMRGAADKAAEAGIPILGGHSIEDSGIKFGMVVTGKVKVNKLITNAGAKAGDLLILTKPIGSGIITKAFTMGIVTDEMLNRTIGIMESLNKTAAEIMLKYPVNACTDVTGFGLVGHLHEMTEASSVDVSLYYDAVPLMDGVEKLANLGAIPGSTLSNENFAKGWTDFGTLNSAQKAVVCDSQTSGGLLISITKELAGSLLDDLAHNQVTAGIIGEITGKGTGKITIGFKKDTQATISM